MCSTSYDESFILYRVLVSAKENFGYVFMAMMLFWLWYEKNQFLKMGASTVYFSVPLDFFN